MDLLLIPLTLIVLHGEKFITKTAEHSWLILLSFRVSLFRCMHPESGHKKE